MENCLWCITKMRTNEEMSKKSISMYEIFEFVKQVRTLLSFFGDAFIFSEKCDEEYGYVTSVIDRISQHFISMYFLQKK